jgi:hypothetical protein
VWCGIISPPPSSDLVDLSRFNNLEHDSMHLMMNLPFRLCEVSLLLQFCVLFEMLQAMSVFFLQARLGECFACRLSESLRQEIGKTVKFETSTT